MQIINLKQSQSRQKRLCITVASRKEMQVFSKIKEILKFITCETLHFPVQIKLSVIFLIITILIHKFLFHTSLLYTHTHTHTHTHIYIYIFIFLYNAFLYYSLIFCPILLEKLTFIEL
jgi:hypothetical protein